MIEALVPVDFGFESGVHLTSIFDLERASKSIRANSWHLLLLLFVEEEAAFALGTEQISVSLLLLRELELALLVLLRTGESLVFESYLIPGSRFERRAFNMVLQVQILQSVDSIQVLAGSHIGLIQRSEEPVFQAAEPLRIVMDDWMLA